MKDAKYNDIKAYKICFRTVAIQDLQAELINQKT